MCILRPYQTRVKLDFGAPQGRKVHKSLASAERASEANSALFCVKNLQKFRKHRLNNIWILKASCTFGPVNGCILVRHVTIKCVNCSRTKKTFVFDFENAKNQLIIAVKRALSEPRKIARASEKVIFGTLVPKSIQFTRERRRRKQRKLHTFEYENETKE